MDWKNQDAEYARDYAKRLDDLMPEPLFESFLLPAPKVCLRCASNLATSLLYSPFGMKPVLPLCGRCAADWNVAGYAILKGIKPGSLAWRLAKFKLTHPFSPPSVSEIYRDVQNMLRWAQKMRRLGEKQK